MTDSEQIGGLDHWIVCPSCGSIKARLDFERPALFAVCPECHNLESVDYPEQVVR